MDREMDLPTIRARRSIGLIALGLGAYLAYLYHVGLEDIAQSFLKVDPTIFAIAIALSLMNVIFNALSWKKVVDELDYQISLANVFFIYMSSIFMNNIIPSGSISGETARIYFLDKIAGNSRIDATSAAVAATRIIMALPFFLGMSMGLVYLVFFTEVPSWALSTCFAMIFLMASVGAVFVGVCFSESHLQYIVSGLVGLVERVSHRDLDRNLFRSVTSRFHESMELLKNRNAALIVSTFWAFAGWLCLNLVAFAAFRSLDVEVSLLAIFAVYSVIIVFQTVPLIVPGGVGVVEMLMTALFAAVGISVHDAAVVTILSRVAQLWFHMAIGGVSTVYLLRTVERGVGQRENRREKRKTGAG